MYVGYDDVWQGPRPFDGLNSKQTHSVIHPGNSNRTFDGVGQYGDMEDLMAIQITSILVGSTVGAFLGGLAFAIASKIIPVSVKKK